MKFLISLITALVVTVNSGLTSANRFIDKLASKNTKKIVVLTKEKPSSEENSPSVLGVETQNDDIDSVTFNVNTIFKNGIKVRQGADLSSLTASSIDLGSGQIRAGNILYGVVGGDGIVISSGQTPIISLSLAGGDGIKIDGNKIVNTGIIGLSAGVGISVSGSSITNIDPGSSQNIFKTISVAGQDDIVADKNDDTLTLTAGTGISILTDPTNDKLTFFSNDPSIAAGWTHGVDSIFLTNLTDNVGIGIEDPSAKLEVVGSVKFSGGLNNSSGGIINAGSITGATGFTSSGTITLADLSTGIVHSNIYGVLSSSAVNLANTDVTGILPVAHGGLGLTSVTTGGIVYGSSPNIYSVLGAGGEGEVLTMSSGIPSWATVTGAGGICANCLINNPGSNQTITPADTSATGLIVKQASGGLVDIFKVTDSTGSTAYLRVDSSGNVLLGNGQTTQGIFTVSPSGSHAMSISPSSTVGTPHTGTMTSEDLTENRTWTFPDQSGIICTTAGNCSGTSSAIGGNGSLGYLSKWSGTYALTNSLLYDNGINVGIGTTIPGYKLDINGSLRATGQTLLDNTLTVSNTATMSSALYVKGPASLSSTLGVTGATTLSSTLDVTGNAIFNGNMGIGTSSPLTPLHIGTTPGDYRANPTLSFGDGDTGIYEQSDDVLGFATGGEYRMFISSTGIFNPASTGTLLISNSAGSSTNPLYSFYADSNTGIGYPGADSISLIAGGSSKLVATTTGVGIGTSSPVNTLNVSGADGSGNIGRFNNLLISTTPNNAGAGFGIYGNSASIGVGLFNYNGPIVFATSTGGTPAEKVRIDSSGNVGIGTTSPSQSLDIKGVVRAYKKGSVGRIEISGANATGYITGPEGSPAGIIIGSDYEVFMSPYNNDRIYKFTTNTLKMEYAAAGISLASTTGPHQISTGGSSNLALMPGGNVGIGTTSPTGKLHVSGAVTGKALAIFDETGDQALLTASASGVTKFTIDHSGKVGIGIAPTYALDVKASGTGVIARFNSDNATGCTLGTDGTLSCSSDRSLKKNIDTINYGLTDVLNLNPVAFNWNFDEDSSDKSLGFIAQDVETIIPGLVSTDTNGLKTLNTIGLIPVLTKALQEQQLQINNLTNQTNLTNLTNITLQTLEAQGAVTFKSTAEFQGNTIFKALAEFFENAIFHKNVTFAGKAKFNKDTAGIAVISTYTNEVYVKFESAYENPPVVNITLNFPDKNDQTFVEDGLKAAITDVSTDGFSIVLPTLAVRDFSYNWTAIAVDRMTTTKSTSVIQDILGSQNEATPEAQPSPAASTGEPTIIPNLTITPEVEATPSPTIEQPTLTPALTSTP